MEWTFRRENSHLRSRILHGVACESMDLHRKVLILHDTFVKFLKKWRFRCINSTILILERQNSTPLSRIRNGVAVLSREFESQIADPRQGCKLENPWIFMEKYWFCVIHASNFEKSVNFAAYIQKFSFWGLRIRRPYRGSEMEWLFCRENSRVRSRIFDRGRRFPVIFVNSMKNCDFVAYIWKFCFWRLRSR